MHSPNSLWATSLSHPTPPPMAACYLLLSLSLCLLSPTFADDAAPSPTPPPIVPISARGPILTEGKNYTHVCHPERFAALGLDMSGFAYCDKSLPYETRAKKLVESMTLAEKVWHVGDNMNGVERIGLPKYRWWSEALHGVSFVGHTTYFGDVVPGCTSFPTPIVSAASFNESLWRSIGETISTEARAMYNLGHTGLTFWSPNINVVRDPRWGRVLETPGEDPFVVGRYAVNFVRGMQDIKGQEVTEDLNSRPIKVSTCCKHYAAYDVENWMGVDRWHFNSIVTEQDMVETFLAPFETCVKEGDASSVMCSFNNVNGIPVCADARLLSGTIRKDWNLHGYIVSDCDSVDTIVNGQKWLNDTPADAVQQVIRAGLDLQCSHFFQPYTTSAVEQGKIREADIDKALKNLFLVLMRVGFFDGMPQYASLGLDHICTQANIDLAADAARQGIVLLKNNNSALPLNSNARTKVALVGPHANATDAMIGNYAGTPCRYVSPLDAFVQENALVVDYAAGCDVVCTNGSLFGAALNAAKDSDVTFIFAGLDLDIEAEGRDRTDFLLPGLQQELITEVAEAAKGTVVLVIMSAGNLDLSFAKESPHVDAIIWAGYPGGEGGRAIADIVFGRYNPGGRLPITWYEASYVDQLPLTSMRLRPVDELSYPGRTYKFFEGSTVYPFGYGLSYTQFKYTLSSPTMSVTAMLGRMQLCRTVAYKSEDIPVQPCPAITVDDAQCTEEVKFNVNVANTGSRDGSHVLLVYGIPPKEIAGAPNKQIVGFQRVFVEAGKSKTVKFSLNVCKSLSIVDKSAYKVVVGGEHTIQVGDGDTAQSFPVQVKFRY